MIRMRPTLTPELVALVQELAGPVTGAALVFYPDAPVVSLPPRPYVTPVTEEPAHAGP